MKEGVMRQSKLVLASVLVVAIAACTGTGPAATPSPTTTSPSTTSGPTAVATQPPVTVSPTPAATATPAPVATSTATPVSQCLSEPTADTGTHTPGTAQPLDISGRILFGLEASDHSGTFGLAYIDETGQHEISTEPDWTMAHEVWETERTVLFDSERNGDRHIFRLFLDEPEVEQVTSGELTGQSNASIAPDGQIFYGSWSCETLVDYGIHSAAPDGTDVKEVTPARQPGDEGYDDQPVVSPDGQSVVFVRHTDEQHGALFVVPAAGGPATRLTPDGTAVDYPRWSPDGTKILFSQLLDQVVDLFVITPEGGEPVHVTNNPSNGSSFEGDWSLDGTQVLFKHYEEGWNYNELWIADTDGSNTQVLWTGDHSTAETPDWSY